MLCSTFSQSEREILKEEKNDCVIDVVTQRHQPYKRIPINVKLFI